MITLILDILYPRRCLLCRDLTRSAQRDLDLCSACEQELPRLIEHCRQCALPLYSASRVPHDDAGLCGQCQQKAPRFDASIALFHYQQPVAWMIQQMKFHNKPAIARLFGKLLAEAVGHRINNLPDAILPVPLHSRRERERGYNQSNEIARAAAARLKLPLDTHLLQRHVPGQVQSGLNARERRKNVRGVFRVKPGLKPGYRHVAVIDDVMSTGSTLNEISRVLKAAGIQRVDNWVIARAAQK